MKHTFPYMFITIFLTAGCLYIIYSQLYGVAFDILHSICALLVLCIFIFFILYKRSTMQSSTSHRNKRIEVNGASLIDLKAEISRRQIEVKAKASNVPNVSAPVLKRSGGGGISGLLKRPVSPPHKIQKPADNTEAEKSAEEQAAWDAARRKLEAKARLYDALKQAAAAGTAKFDDREDDKAPLVDFERKAMEVNTIDTDSSDDDGDKNGRNNRIGKS